jgi:hypothetical protein
MKTVLAFSGISYGPGQRDWRRCIDNIKQNIIDPIGVEDVFFTTYPSETFQQLVEAYKPKKYNVLEYADSDKRTTYIKTLELLLDQDFDLAITTRFDIQFTGIPVNEYALDFAKINLLFKEGGWWDIYRYTADPQTFCVFPKSLLPVMIETVQNIYTNPHSAHADMHPFYNYTARNHGSSIMHIIHDVKTLSHCNPFFIFDRWNPGFEAIAGSIRKSEYFEKNGTSA